MTYYVFGGTLNLAQSINSAVWPCSIHHSGVSRPEVDKQNLEHMPHGGRLTSMLEPDTSSKWLFLYTSAF